MNIDICKKTKTKINYSEIKIKIKKLHAHNVRQSLPYTYRLCLEIEKKLAYFTFLTYFLLLKWVPLHY